MNFSLENLYNALQCSLFRKTLSKKINQFEFLIIRNLRNSTGHAKLGKQENIREFGNLDKYLWKVKEFFFNYLKWSGKS